MAHQQHLPSLIKVDATLLIIVSSFVCFMATLFGHFFHEYIVDMIIMTTYTSYEVAIVFMLISEFGFTNSSSFSLLSSLLCLNL